MDLAVKEVLDCNYADLQDISTSAFLINSSLLGAVASSNMERLVANYKTKKLVPVRALIRQMSAFLNMQDVELSQKEVKIYER